MPSILLEIQETVKKYADIMSKVAQVEVEVVDEPGISKMTDKHCRSGQPVKPQMFLYKH